MVSLDVNVSPEGLDKSLFFVSGLIRFTTSGLGILVTKGQRSVKLVRRHIPFHGQFCGTQPVAIPVAC
jgi:hypothetical protein